jgi:hypothetical protein
MHLQSRAVSRSYLFTSIHPGALILNIHSAGHRFGRNETSEFLYTIVNTSADGVSGRRRGARAVDRKAYITIWDTKTWTQVKTRSIGNRPVTCFDVR